MTVEPVRVVPYDSNWPSLFARERILVKEVMGRWVESIEHVGSTAIYGLDAKPVVDLMVGLRSMYGAGSCEGPLTHLGYSY